MSEPTGNQPGQPPPEQTPLPDPTTDDPTSQPPDSSSSAPPPQDTSSDAVPPEQSSTTESLPPEETTTSAPLPEESTTSQPEPDPEPTPTEQETTTTEAEQTTTVAEQTTTTSEAEETTGPSETTITLETSSDGSVQTSVIVITQTKTQPRDEPTAGPTTTGAEPGTIDPSGGSNDGGLDQGAKVAIGVVVPIVAIALIAIAVLFWWKKRRARQEAEEERRKEVEDYSYNPNADPTIPAVGGMQENYEMREDGSSGYRGWGSTTLAGSTGRKASTTMSGGVAGPAYSDVTTSPGRGGGSEARSGEPLMEGEILGAMGPSAANNRNGDVRRGPSNASSSYSAANRSENSDGMGMAYSDGGYDQYAQNNPYVDNGYGGRGQELPGQPVIRDNPARRNTRIENPSHFPQQSAGISQNF
ncbi:hypothetical protein CC79DRAFT_1323856 [Sarocladium strictum]